MTNAQYHHICFHFPFPWHVFALCFALTWSRGAQYPETGLGILGHINPIVEGIEVGSAIVVGIGQLLLREEPLRPGDGGDNNCHRNAAMSNKSSGKTMHQRKWLVRLQSMHVLTYTNTHSERNWEGEHRERESEREETEEGTRKEKKGQERSWQRL